MSIIQGYAALKWVQAALTFREQNYILTKFYQIDSQQYSHNNSDCELNNRIIRKQNRT